MRSPLNHRQTDAGKARPGSKARWDSCYLHNLLKTSELRDPHGSATIATPCQHHTHTVPWPSPPAPLPSGTAAVQWSTTCQISVSCVIKMGATPCPLRAFSMPRPFPHHDLPCARLAQYGMSKALESG